MKSNILLAFFLVFFGNGFSQQLVSYEFITEYNKGQIDSIYLANGIPGLTLPSTYDIRAYKVVYNTLDADSNPTIASGAFFIPVNPACKAPLATYQHGTILNKEDVPSRLAGVEVIIGISMAADGYVVNMPDYLGLGDSPGLHPYVHAATEAQAVADMLLASLQICDEMDIELSDQVFLLGYSQGGHATMAAHQVIQANYSDYFSVVATAPMSGPYDLSGVQAEIISTGGVYPNPGYLPYLLFAYDQIYHIYDEVSDYLISPYDSILPPLFDGTHSMDEVNAVMPLVPNEIVVPAVLDSFNNDPDYKLHGYLELNDTYHWIPQSLLRMYYCEGDMDVNYQNAFVAYDSFIAYGASGISMQSSGLTLDHEGCAYPSLLSAKFWFDSLRLDKLKLNFDIEYESFPGAQDGSLTVHASSGFPPYTYSWSNGGTDSIISNLVTGLYTVTVYDATGCPASATIYLPVQVGIDEVVGNAITISPNPFTTFSKIVFPVESNYIVTLTDISGRTLETDNFFGTEFLLLRKQIPSGVYLLRIDTESGVTVLKKIIAD